MQTLNYLFFDEIGDAVRFVTDSSEGFSYHVHTEVCPRLKSPHFSFRNFLF